MYKMNIQTKKCVCYLRCTVTVFFGISMYLPILDTLNLIVRLHKITCLTTKTYTTSTEKVMRRILHLLLNCCEPLSWEMPNVNLTRIQRAKQAVFEYMQVMNLLSHLVTGVHYITSVHLQVTGVLSQTGQTNEALKVEVDIRICTLRIVVGLVTTGDTL